MHPFLTKYSTVAVPALTAKKQYASPYLVPKVQKVSVNVGIGDLRDNNGAIESLSKLVAAITGQKPMQTRARKAIAGFKIRQNMVVGLTTTLRGERMQDFLTKLIQISLPRTRDFRGIRPTSVTPNGTLNIGIRDSMIFPESPQETAGHSLQVTIVSTARTQEEAQTLYESLGFVFSTDQEQPRKRVTRYRGKK